jgi:TetR/AcrR family transcriptional regulator, cholesterol catabolism regulator
VPDVSTTRRRREYVANATARKQILEAAAELFTNRGFHATSVREIGDHLGIGQSSLYYHAKNKAQILVDINAELMDGLVAEMEEIEQRDGSGLEKLESVVHTLLRKIAAQQAAVTVVLHERRSVPAEAAVELQAKRDRVDAIIDGILRQGMEDGTVRPLPLGLTRLAITGMTNWAYTWYDPEGTLDVDEIADFFLDLLRHGLAGDAVERQGASRRARRLSDHS